GDHRQAGEDAEQHDREAEHPDARPYRRRGHGEAVRRRRRHSDTEGGPNTARSAARAATVANSTDTEGPSWGSATDARLDTICPFGSSLESTAADWSPAAAAASVPVAAAAAT